MSASHLVSQFASWERGEKTFSANIFYMDLKMNFQKLISGTEQFEALLTSTRHEGLIDEPGPLEITDLPISMLYSKYSPLTKTA